MSTPITYWGGSSVLDGRVRKLTATNFRELVQRYVNIPVQHALTRKEFWALASNRERDQVKDGHFLCACSFAYENEGRRSDENATHSVGVVLDLDEGAFVKELDENPDTIAEHLYPYNFAAWRTAKYTPENPRLKILVDVAPCHPSHHRRILSFIASRLGLPRDFKGVRESGVISQPQYRPLMFKGEEFSAVIASNVSGVPLHLSDLPELEPEEDEMLNGRTYACDPSEAGDDFFGLAYLPVAGLELSDVAEAVNAIDPDCEYREWLQVAAALRHQFTDEAEAQAAYEMFVEWSSHGKKYEGRKDCWTRWKSFRPYAKGRAPVTVRTIYMHAMTAGWDNNKVAKKISQTITDWFATCTDKDILMQEGAKRIASVPFRNEVVEEALLIQWRKRIYALTDEHIDKATLKRELNKVRRADSKAKADARGDSLPSWLRPVVYIGTTDVFHNLGNGTAFRPGAFDRFFAVEMMPKDETPATGMPIMQPSAFALNIHRIMRVEETIYDPTKEETETIFSCPETGKILLNTYNHGSVPVADPEFKDMAEKLFYQLIRPMVREPHLLEMLIDYCALQVQFPGRKIPWSFLIQSAPGCGKGTLGEVMEAVMGPTNVKIISPNMMTASFNEWAVGSAFGIFNEVHIPGERRDQVMNSIKPCISDPTIAVTLKHRDGMCRVKNFTNYIAFTNDKDAAHLASEDRRWGIIFAPMQTRDQIIKLQLSGHFDAVRWLITPAGASALRYFLSKRKISDDFPLNGHAPDTIYRQEVIAQSKNHLQVAIEDLIEDGTEPLVGPEVVHDGRLKELVCRTPRDSTLLTRYLSLIGYERETPARRVMVDAVRGHLWVHTERWRGGDTVAYLKARLKEVPSLLDDSDDEEPTFE